MKSLDIYKWHNLPSDVTIPPMSLWEQIRQQSLPPSAQGFRPIDPIYYGIVDYGNTKSLKRLDKLYIADAKIVEIIKQADLTDPHTDIIAVVGVLRYSRRSLTNVAAKLNRRPPWTKAAAQLGLSEGTFFGLVGQPPMFGIQVYMWDEKYWLDAVDAHNSPYMHRIILPGPSGDLVTKKKLSVIYPIGATNG